MPTRRRFFGLFPALAGVALIAKAEPTTRASQMAMIEGAAAPLQAVQGTSSACTHPEIVETMYSVPRLFEQIIVKFPQTATTGEGYMEGLTDAWQRRSVQICLQCGALFSSTLKNELINERKDQK